MKHKKYVYKLMSVCGYPIRGLVHDMSKFQIIELKESIKYYNGKRSPLSIAKEKQGYSLAWLHHVGKNKHHSAYWVDITNGIMNPCKIPWVYLVEQICDTISAEKVYHKDWDESYPNTWWKNSGSLNIYHDDTRILLNYVYSTIEKKGWGFVSFLISSGILEKFYDNIDCLNLGVINFG